MKKSLGLLVLGMVLVGCSTLVGALGENVEKYSCQNLSDKVVIQYLENGDKIALKTNVKNIEMKREVSASGNYYQNGQNSFHTNGKTAILELNGIETSCGIIK